MLYPLSYGALATGHPIPQAHGRSQWCAPLRPPIDLVVAARLEAALAAWQKRRTAFTAACRRCRWQ